MENFSQETLKNVGFDLDNLTKEQIDVLSEPIDAPENYAHDGEYSPEENRKIWFRKLVSVGLARKDLTKAMKIIS